MIVIEGMGVVGCTLARALAAKGQHFTWFDKDIKPAWTASTGCIFGWRGDWAGYYAWLEELVDPTLPLPIERVPFYRGPTFSRQHRADTRDALILNVQEYVRSTREMFKMEWSGPHWNGGVDHVHPMLGYVRCHAIPDRWERGWHRLVTLDWPDRRAVEVRWNRAAAVYTYPCPGTDQWYAGGSGGFGNWCQRMLHDEKELLDYGPLVEGWRPRGKSDKLAWFASDGAIQIAALGSTGVTRAPLVVREVLDMLMLVL